MIIGRAGLTIYRYTNVYLETPTLPHARITVSSRSKAVRADTRITSCDSLLLSFAFSTPSPSALLHLRRLSHE